MYEPIFLESGGMRLSPIVKTPVITDDDCSFIAKILSECQIEGISYTEELLNNRIYYYEPALHFYQPLRQCDYNSDSPMSMISVSWIGKMNGAGRTTSSILYTIASGNFLLPRAEFDELHTYLKSVLEYGIAKLRYHLYNEDSTKPGRYPFHHWYQYTEYSKGEMIKKLKDFGVCKYSDGKTISLVYDGYNILDISDQWRLIIKADVWDKYKLSRYNVYELKYEFAKYLVKILNNR